MPEFIMPVDETDPRWRGLDEFTKGYIEAMFFTDIANPDCEDEFGDDPNFAMLSDKTLLDIAHECAAFQDANSEALDEAYTIGGIGEYEMRDAGRDYWYSRNGHGVGYWDRELGDVGDKLHDAAFGERWPYRGDDGLIYVG